MTAVGSTGPWVVHGLTDRSIQDRPFSLAYWPCCLRRCRSGADADLALRQASLELPVSLNAAVQLSRWRVKSKWKSPLKTSFVKRPITDALITAIVGTFGGITVRVVGLNVNRNC